MVTRWHAHGGDLRRATERAARCDGRRATRSAASRDERDGALAKLDRRWPPCALPVDGPAPASRCGKWRNARRATRPVVHAGDSDRARCRARRPVGGRQANNGAREHGHRRRRKSHTDSRAARRRCSRGCSRGGRHRAHRDAGVDRVSLASSEGLRQYERTRVPLVRHHDRAKPGWIALRIGGVPRIGGGGRAPQSAHLLDRVSDGMEPRVLQHGGCHLIAGAPRA